MEVIFYELPHKFKKDVYTYNRIVGKKPNNERTFLEISILTAIFEQLMTKKRLLSLLLQRSRSAGEV